MRMNLNGVVGEITTLPGCSQIGVSHGVFLPENQRGKGIGTAAMYARLCYAFYDLGYDVLLCTVEYTNLVQKNILIKSGWMLKNTFTSSKTGHAVQVWMITKAAFEERDRENRATSDWDVLETEKPIINSDTPPLRHRPFPKVGTYPDTPVKPSSFDYWTDPL